MIPGNKLLRPWHDFVLKEATVSAYSERSASRSSVDRVSFAVVDDNILSIMS